VLKLKRRKTSDILVDQIKPVHYQSRSETWRPFADRERVGQELRRQPHQRAGSHQDLGSWASSMLSRAAG